MAIITISQGTASGGRLLAEKLAEELRYEVVSRDQIVSDAAAFGVPEEDLRAALLKPPSFLDRFKHTRRRYLAFVRYALCQRAAQDNLLYHGNAGHHLLKGLPHLLCVRVIASMAFRVDQVMKRQGVNRSQALKRIRNIDCDRDAWCKLLYGANPLDPALYDLLINLRRLDVAGAAGVVVAATRQPQLATTDAGRQAMADLLLASKVKAELAASDDTAYAEVTVQAEEDTVYLSGRLRSEAQVEAVLNVTADLEGVTDVNRDGLGAPHVMV